MRNANALRASRFRNAFLLEYFFEPVLYLFAMAKQPRALFVILQQKGITVED
jgi:hypothetical protein